MPYMTNGKRDVAKQNRLYDSKKKAREHRAQGVKIQRELEALGIAHVGDGKDNAHKTAFSKGGTADPSNVKLEDPGSNRSFKRKKNSKLASEVSTRERK